ncbi:MAG: DnaJ domain-containing protein [Polyangiaceae bacterium]|nr:DnaJ domain-containing protein [Polyangiaceae bacterium]
MAEAPVATASGTLDKTPLVNLVVYVLDRRLSGTLVLESPDRHRHAVFFEAGHPAKARVAGEVARLGAVLSEIVPLDPAAVEEACEAAALARRLVGEELLQRGLVDADGLLAGLRESLSRKVAHLFHLPDETAYAFYAGVNLLERWGAPESTTIDGLSLVVRGVRARPFDPRVDAALRGLGDAKLRLHVRGDLRRFRLLDRGRGIVEILKVRPMPLAGLLSAGVADELDVRLIVYAFLLTRHLDLGTGKAPVGVEDEDGPLLAPRGSPRPPAARPPSGVTDLRSITAAIAEEARAASPPASLPPGLAERRQEIRDRAAKIDGETYFAMLGVALDSPPEVVQSAYFGLAKRWHPDRLPEQLGEVREQAAKVFSRMSEAFQTLSDPEKRAQYMNLMKGGGATPEEQAKVAAVIEAQMDFQRAEVCLKRGDLAGARKYGERARAKDPDQIDYKVLDVWVAAISGQPKPDDLARCIEQLDLLLASEPNHQRALQYRGALLKRVGNDARAVRDFRKLLELDPRNLDAEREIRVYEMRHGGEKPDKPASNIPFAGLLDRLKKK